MPKNNQVSFRKSQKVKTNCSNKNEGVTNGEEGVVVRVMTVPANMVEVKFKGGKTAFFVPANLTAI
jgi:hypothetical protein